MILVTGATGFIGGHLVDRLTSLGRAVRCLVRRSSAIDALPLARIELAHADLGSGEGLAEALHGIETVIHLAGVTKARVPADYDRGNAEATGRLLDASHGVRRFVHVSSLAAAGPSADRPLTEEDVAHPVSCYGRSKLAGEERVRQSALRGRAVIVRPPVVYGPGDRDVFQVLRAVANGWMLQIGSAQRYFSFIYVEDLVDGLIAAADREAAGGRTYYVAHARPASWQEFGEAAARLMGRRLRSLSIPEKAAFTLGWCAERWARLSGRPGILSRDKVTEACCAGWVCDTGRCREELGYEAPTALEEGLQRTLSWYREAGWLKR